MSNSNKWSMKGKILISKCINKEAEIFQFFNAHVTFNMAMCLGTVCGVFFLMCDPWLSKGQRHFWGALWRKGRNDKIWDRQQNIPKHIAILYVTCALKNWKIYGYFFREMEINIFHFVIHFV